MTRPLLGGSARIRHRHLGSVCVIGLHCPDVCNLKIAHSSRDRVLAFWDCVSRLFGDRLVLGSASHPAALLRVFRGAAPLR